MTDDPQVGGGGTSVSPQPVLFAIGDIHGAYHALEEILDTLDRRHGIFTDADKCVLSDHVTLVFTGDYVDRGNHATQVLNRLAYIKQGSSDRLVLLMGNHEAMALAALGAYHYYYQGDFEVPSRIFDAMVKHAISGGHSLYREIAKKAEVSVNNKRERARAFLEEIGREGPAGRLMRGLDLLHFRNIAGHVFLFSHGDVAEKSRSLIRLQQLQKEFYRHMQRTIPYELQFETIDWVKRYDEELPGRDEVWERDYTRHDFPEGDPEEMKARAAAEICKACGVDYIVAGHTASQDGRIRVFGGRIFHIDVGMWSMRAEFRGPPTAMMVSDEGIASVTAARDKLLVEFRGCGDRRRD